MNVIAANSKKSEIENEDIDLGNEKKISPFTENIKIQLIRVALLITVLITWEVASGTIIDTFWMSEPSAIFQTLYTLLLSG